MTVQAERVLQQEIMLRLRAGNWPVVTLGVPNGAWLPARTPAERMLVARIIARLKSDGMMTVGAPDIVIAFQGHCLFVELKRERSRDLLGRITPAGRLSEAQQNFQAQCNAVGVPYLVAHSWEDVSERLREWGSVA